jgi:3-isopropylmalate/(R)-2-methylmalate dehydratase small subunit
MTDGDVNFTGRTWVVGDNINTDLILPGRAQLFTEEEQVRCVFEGNRPGWVDQVTKGDILIGGENFGMGSSRPAARSLRNLGLSCLVAESLNGLFYRNCINWGLFALECPGVAAAFDEGDVAEVSFTDFTVTNQRSGEVLQAGRVPDTLLSTLRAGGVFPLLEAEGLIAPKI